MKKLTTTILFILFYVLAAKAQYDENFTFWYNAVKPDNSLAKILAKEGFKSLTVVGYEPEADDTAQTMQNEVYNKYDAKGMLVYTSAAPSGKDLSYASYTYDKRGKLTKYAYSQGKLPETYFEFSSDKKKGYKAILTNNPKYTWDTAKVLLKAVNELDTQYYYFNKFGLPDKYVLVYREKEFAKGFYYTETTTYKYDKSGNITEYYMVEKDRFGDTIRVEKGMYIYNESKLLAMAVINKFDYSFSNTQPQLAVEHSYAYVKGTDRLKDHTVNEKKYYENGGKIIYDASFRDYVYAYNDKGLPLSHTESRDPGIVTVHAYRFEK